MRKSCYIFALLFFFVGLNQIWSRDGLSLGFTTGFEADTFKYGQKYGAIALNNAKIIGVANFWNDLNSSVSISEVFVDTQLPDVEIVATNTNGFAVFENFPIELKNNVGQFSYVRPEKNAQALVSLPLGGVIKYSYKFLLFRFGFSYDLVISNSFQPTTENSFIWNDNALTFPGAAGGTLSGQDVFDLVLQNAKDSGQAILPSTGGRDVTISQKTSGARIDAPLSIALQFINTYALKAYVGGGITYHWGKVTRILQDSLPNTKADIDTYQGSTIGFHLLTGIEYEIITRLGLSAEIFFNYGDAGPLQDQVITEDPFTVASFFHDPKTDIIGPEDRNNPQYSRLEFSGIRLVLGLNYYILD